MKDSFLDEELLEKAKKEKIKLVFDRFEEQQPQCSFGLVGVCCRNCFAGPCRIIPGKQEKGICGASADTIVARNLLRTTAAGAACHSDHAREILLTLLKIGEGKTNYTIKDEEKLRALAELLGKKHKGNIREVAKEVALEALEDFRRQEGVFHESEGKYLNWLRITATKERQKLWKGLGILPINADYEINHAMHKSTMGNEADPISILLDCLRLSLVDGYAGMHLSTDLQDVIFGTPHITKSEANLGVIKKDYVNIAVHGHVPLLSEKVVEYAKKLEPEARKVGAKGINVVGICCTGNEVLMRHGIHLAGHILQSELAIVTGALEVLIADLQCTYPSLQDVASCYHTKLITTALAKIPGAYYTHFTVENADEEAEKMIRIAIDNFKNRDKSRVLIPKEKTTLYSGFSPEAIIHALKKMDKKDPLKPLIDNIVKGNVFGIVAVVGCRNPKLRGEKFAEKLIKELLKNNILVLTTGCISHSAAQEGLMLPEAVEYAGDGLKRFLIKLGKANGLSALPPVLHLGSCVDNSRIEKIVNSLANRLKVPINRLPIAASAPEYVTEKAVSIALWALSLGIGLHVNPTPPVTGSKLVTKFLTQDLEKITGGKVLLADKAENAAKVIIDHIKEKRKKLI